jgi:hypothetical protein
VDVRWNQARRCVQLADGTVVAAVGVVPDDIQAEYDDVFNLTMRDWHQVLASADDDDYKVIIFRESNFILIDDRATPQMWVSVHAEGPDWKEWQVAGAVDVLIAAQCADLHHLAYEDRHWILEFTCSADGRTVADIFAMQDLVAKLVALPDRPSLDAMRNVDGVYRLVKAGMPDALIGLAESAWLEVKSQAYDLPSFAAEIELAQDVARFANGDQSGLLALGFRTERRDGSDRIVKLALLDIPGKTVAQYKAVIERRIYPPIEGIILDLVRMQSGRAVLVIVVPKQPEAAKPFLVTGAIVDGRNEGAFISIVRRRGEESIAVTAAEIHAMLSAGRNVLRKS